MALRCYIPDCTYSGRFTRRYELERHIKDKHELEPAVGNKKFYRCQVHSCHQYGRLWTRRDKFRQHIIRVHPFAQVEELVNAYGRLGPNGNRS
jgi:hypothetical protein